MTTGGVTQIGKAILAVADQQAMLDFFVGTLGFEPVADTEMWPGARWVEVRPPGAPTSLVLSAAADFDRSPDPAYPMTFFCADLAATVARYRAAGAVVSDPVREPWGTFVRVTDPEGRELLVNEQP